MSWTSRRDTAALYTVDAQGSRNPPLLGRVIPRPAILAIFDHFGDGEAVVDPTFALPPAEVDGSPDDWHVARERKRRWFAAVARDLEPRADDAAFMRQWSLWRVVAVRSLAAIFAPLHDRARSELTKAGAAVQG